MKTCDRDEFMAWLEYRASGGKDRASDGTSDGFSNEVLCTLASKALSAGEKVGMTEYGKLVSYIDYDGEEFVETFLPDVD